MGFFHSNYIYINLPFNRQILLGEFITAAVLWKYGNSFHA